MAIPVPALVVDVDALDHNIRTIGETLPGSRLRPHVKAFKSTALAQRLADAGHRAFTCATVREVEGMAAAGLGDDLLLANEVLDRAQLQRLADVDALVTIAVDSDEGVDRAAATGLRNVLIDVNVGLPRCGIAPGDAGRLADRARSAGLEVRGVMGYEGHLMMVEERSKRIHLVEKAMALLLMLRRRSAVTSSRRGTGTYDTNTWASEIQAGTFLLGDSQYQRSISRSGRRSSRVFDPVEGRWLRRRECGTKGARDGPRRSALAGGAGHVLQRRAHHLVPSPERPSNSISESALCPPTSTRPWRDMRRCGSSTAPRLSTNSRST